MSARSGSKTHHVEEIKIPVPWGEVAGRWWGPKDRQPILATHGWQDNAGTWNRLIPLLPPTLSVLCIDLPGMGLSSHYPKGMVYYKYWDGLVLLRRIVKHFKWEKVVLMGHSLGGSISFMYAAMFPDDIDRLICVDIASPAMQTTEDTIKVASTSIDQMLRYENFKNNALSESYEEMIDMVVEAYAGSISRENCKVMMERGMSRNVFRGKVGYYFNRDPKLKFSSLGLISIEEALEMVKKIKCRILNIKANPAPNISHTFYEYYDKVLVALQESTDVTFVEVDGTHHVHLEAPERIVAHVHAFIEDLC
ncbi:probable serine hydrolase isoform X3 [Aricia agestis]|uniref:probable serine hydrolase isoform X2 n=1 Tax=Aricia agestis TaxID=91739 RepID=UPI001C208EF8|nr:probable serine hydrolase isoform X2 [Aricia agestis]XP_041978918.1 probable serine hydrolase isoform X3 [Aricia agestis]